VGVSCTQQIAIHLTNWGIALAILAGVAWIVWRLSPDED
jgi:hypothetical protein